MAVDSQVMRNFRANVLDALEDVEGGASGLVRTMNETRVKKREKEMVSRAFVSNLLNGHKPCSLTFAEEIANALGAPLSKLISEPRKHARQTA